MGLVALIGICVFKSCLSTPIRVSLIVIPDMFVAEKHDATLEAQSGALYAPRHPTSQRVPFGNGIVQNHPEHEF